MSDKSNLNETIPKLTNRLSRLQRRSRKRSFGNSLKIDSTIDELIGKFIREAFNIPEIRPRFTSL